MSILPHINAANIPVSVVNGGSGSSTAAGARTNLGLDPITDHDVVGGRLDATSTTVLTWNFYTSNQIRLFNTAWELVKVATAPTAPATDMNGTALAASTVYDVFAIYSSATAFTLGLSRWAVQTAGTSARVAVYDAATTHYGIGDRVTHDGHSWVCIQANSHDAAKDPTTETAYWLDNGVTPTGLQADFKGLYQKDGVWVSGNNATHLKMRWLGVIYLSAAGTFLDDENNRFVSNFYNEKDAPLKSYNTNSSWTGANATLREWYNGTGQIKGQYVNAITRCELASIMLLGRNDTVYINSQVALAINSVTEATITVQQQQAVATYNIEFSGGGIGTFPAGYGYITGLEYTTSNTFTGIGLGGPLGMVVAQRRG